MITCIQCSRQILMKIDGHITNETKGLIYASDCPYCTSKQIKPYERIPIIMSNSISDRAEAQALSNLVPEALQNEWVFENNTLLPPARDVRRNWAARWIPMLDGTRVPHWLIDAPIKGWFMLDKSKCIDTTINTVGIKDDEVIAAGGTQFETGAVRSGDRNHVMYQLISPIGMRRMAETMKEGFDKYGAYNWERGMPIGDLLNHAIAHIYAFLSGIPSVDKGSGKVEDDLAHAAWNLFAAMHIEETHPELDHGLRPKQDDKPTQS